MELHKGYKDRRRYAAVARAEYIHNLSPILKGLELRAAVSVNYTGYYANAYKTEPYRYILKNYDFETGVHTLTAINPNDASRTLNVDDQNTGSSENIQMSYEVRGLHVAAWGEHQTSLTAVFNAQEDVYKRQTFMCLPVNGKPVFEIGAEPAKVEKIIEQLLK